MSNSQEIKGKFCRLILSAGLSRQGNKKLTLPKEMESIAERIRKIRKAVGLTQEEFARRLGKTLKTIQRWESGRYNVPDSALRLIAREFGANYEWLKTGQGSMFEPAPIPATEEELYEWVVREVIRFLKDKGEPITYRKVYRLSELVFKKIKPLWEKERLESQKMWEELSQSLSFYKTFEEE